MKQLKNTTLLATVFAASLHLLLIDASSFTIVDDRVRSLETSPALGRGYSVGTNSYHSGCLMPDETTSPSYNYNYIFTDMTQATDIETELAGKLSTSLSYTAVKTEATAVEAISNSNSDKELFLVVSTMRVDRYFSGLKEESSPITADAKNLLEKQDYIGFFNACGTNYVRSIRRAQEITAIFKFNSHKRDLAQEFASEIKAKGGAPAIDEGILDKEKFSLIKESLEIKVLAYGLGLNTRGESEIVSTTVKNYNKVIEFAFRSFTQTTDSANVGMIYALEFVPWVDNASFQHESKILDVDIELPLPRSLIPKAIADDGISLFFNNNSIRPLFSCKHLFFNIDKYGYCCDATSLFNQELGRYETEDIDVESSSRICKPSRKLEKSLIKNNMSNNGEFVARLDSTVQKKINQLFTLEKCVASVNSMLEKYDSYTLKSQGSAKYDRSMEGKFTVNQLKMTLDPLGDLSFIRHMGNELDEFIDMYYRPCIAALFGTNVGSSPDIEAKYFMAYGWLTHEACSKLSCLADNMRWNRNGSGCIASLITGSKAPTYDLNDNECKKDDEVNPNDGSELCKYDSTDLRSYQTRLNTCWDDPNPTNRIPYYIMEHFCMPEIIGEKIDEEIVHPCKGPCEDIALLLSDSTISDMLSVNALDETIVKCFDTSEVTNMDQILMGSNINADLSSWDVSSVTSMQQMFKTASVFNADLSSWDVSSVTSMSEMFKTASVFNGDISSWDSSVVTSMYHMFRDTTVFNNDISSWDVSSVNTMQGMFYQASIFNNDISSWDVSSNTRMNVMFVRASMFDNDISSWDVSSVTTMNNMFQEAFEFNSDVSSWDIASVLNMSNMFNGATQFDRRMCGWDLSGATNKEGMFTGSECTEDLCVNC